MNFERNDSDADDMITLLALVQRWPLAHLDEPPRARASTRPRSSTRSRRARPAGSR